MVTGQRKSKKSESLQGMESKKNQELCSSRHKTTFLIYDEQARYSATSLMKSRTCVQKWEKGNLRSFPQKHLCYSPRNIQASEKSLKETFQSKEDSKVDL